MITLKKLKAIVLFVALFGGVTAFAQTPQQPVQQEQAKIDVKDAELEEFANIFQQVMQKNQEAQQEMVTLIQKEGLTTERYIALRKAEVDPSAAGEKATDDELSKKKNIDTEIEKLQPKYEKQFDAIVKDSKLGADRYQEIAMAIRYDQDLQQRLQQILVKKASSQSAE